MHWGSSNFVHAAQMVLARERSGTGEGLVGLGGWGGGVGEIGEGLGMH